MWYEPAVVTPHTDEVISLDDAKRHLRISHSDDDAYIQNLIKAARSKAESYCGIRIAGDVLDCKCDVFADFERLGVGPITGITSIKYIDGDGVEQTLSTDVYELRNDKSIVPSISLKYGQSWPVPRLGSQITVRLTTGYTSVPDEIRHAMLLMIGQWDLNREAAGGGSENVPLPFGVDDLLSNHRRFASHY